MTAVTGHKLRLDAGNHPFEQLHRDEIAANWAVEKRAQPALYDGRLVLFSALGIEGGILRGTCHLARFATLLYWRRIRPHPEIDHCFAHAALVSADDKLVAIRMGLRTANSGSVYFAAGSLEEIDFRGGEADLAANMTREVREETGLDLSAMRHEAIDQVLSTSAGTVVFRRYQLPMTASEAVDRIAAHIRGDPDPEIDEAVVIEGPDHHPSGLLPHMVQFRDWHFANPPRFDRGPR